MTPATWFGHPRGLSTLFFTEMWERFSYYGMRSILVLAMVAALEGANPGLGLTRETATAVYGIYTGALYLAALPGGWIADRLLGMRNAVFYGGIIITAGHFTMAVPSTPTFFIGLVLICLGTGLLKPNISAMVGELYPEGGAKRDAGFSIYYMGINLGAFIGQLICGYFGEKIGWHWGFGAAGIFMVVGLIQYRLMGRTLGEIGLQPGGAGDAAARRRGWTTVGVLVAALVAVVIAALTGVLVIDPVRFSQFATGAIVTSAVLYFAYVLLFGGLTRVEKQRVGVLIVLFVGAAVFWSGFEQAGSSFNLFAQDYTDRVFFGWEAPASWLQSINPIFIIVFAPLFAALWIKLGARKLTPSLPLKFALGLLQLALGFAVLFFAAQYVVKGEKVSAVWLTLTYLFHTTGELCLSPVGLSATTKLAPKRYVGQMMGVWFTASALGLVIAGLLAGHLSDESDVAALPDRLLFVTLVCAGAGLVMLTLIKPVRKLMAGVE